MSLDADTALSLALALAAESLTLTLSLAVAVALSVESTLSVVVALAVESALSVAEALAVMVASALLVESPAVTVTVTYVTYEVTVTGVPQEATPLVLISGMELGSPQSPSGALDADG